MIKLNSEFVGKDVYIEYPGWQLNSPLLKGCIETMNIRHAEGSDLPSIAAVQTDSWQDTYAGVLPAEYLANQVPQDLKRHWDEVEIQPEDLVLVADGEGVAGFIAIWCRPDPYIENLHVKPALRSQKLGSALMKSAARHLIQRGHESAYLWVVQSNQRAIRFYEKHGGVQTVRQVNNHFGYEMPCIKIEWTDLSVI